MNALKHARLTHQGHFVMKIGYVNPQSMKFLIALKKMSLWFIAFVTSRMIFQGLNVNIEILNIYIIKIKYVAYSSQGRYTSQLNCSPQADVGLTG